MIPYSSLLFFYVMALLLLPAVVIGLMGRSLKVYGLLFTVAMLAFVFGINGQLPQLLGFYLWQLLLCFAFCRVKHCPPWVFRAVILLALLPMVLVKAGEVVGPLRVFGLMGISYMTFRAVQVLIEVYDGAITQVSLLDYSYFLLFFPSVGSGPIDRYRRFGADIHQQRDRGDYIELLRRGVWRLMWGTLSAIVMGGLIWNNWLAPLPSEGLFATIVYMYGYTFYLFLSFAGTSAMAIGTGCILGVEVPENFRMPFLSVDMKDFWSRWHITLSTWLRDYLYGRFVMRSLQLKRFKNPRTASYIGYCLNMMFMGAWHGFTPNYLLYGVYHSLVMCLNEALDLHWKPFRKIKRQGWTQAVCVLVTFHIYSFGLLIFSGRLLP